MKKNFMKYLLAALVVFLPLTSHHWNTAHANEQEDKDITYKELLIQLMPEYVNPADWSEEGPAVLYGQHGLFVNEGEESFEGPFTVNVPIDDPTFQLALVGKFDGDGIVEEDYTIIEDKKVIQWTPKEPIEPGEEYRFVVEYYYGPFGAGVNKQFTFEQVLDANVENLTILFFEPFEAENVELSVEPNKVMDMYGAPVHEFLRTNLAKGETFQLDISYDKESSITTVEALETMMPPNDEFHQGLGQNGNSNTLLSNESVVMLSISIIIAGVFLYLGLRNRRMREVHNGDGTSEVKKREWKKANDKESELKRIRQQFVDGHIDEETYKKRISKLS